jgi:isopenicillin-N epimerase
MQGLLEPLIVSWGWESERPGPSRFIDHQEWQGTRDLAAYLAVPDAIAYQEQHDWQAVRAYCHTLASETRRRLEALTGLPAVCPEGEDWYAQLFTARLPECDLAQLSRRLYEEHHIEVPVHVFNGQPLIRVSLQGYNCETDVSALLQALQTELEPSL